jgi:hypothetical protein
MSQATTKPGPKIPLAGNRRYARIAAKGHVSHNRGNLDITALLQ